MSGQTKECKYFLAALTVYILGALAYGYHEYHQEKTKALKTIDNQLLIAVSTAENLLQQKLRDNIAGVSPITPDEDFLLSLELKELSETMGLEYVYSVVARENKLFFISSNPSPEELKDLSLYREAFLSPYEDAPKDLFDVFTNGKVTFSEYNDRWGSFRSVFFPLKDSDQNTYVIGVDIKISEVKKLMFRSFYRAIIYSFVLGLIAFPLVYFYTLTLRRNYQNKLELLTTDSLTGLPNQRRLEDKIKNSDNVHLLIIEFENFSRISSVLGVAATDNLILRLSYLLTELKVEKIDLCEWYLLSNHRFVLFSENDFNNDDSAKIIAAVYQALGNSNLSLDIKDQIPLVVRMGAVRNQDNPLLLAEMALSHAKQTNQSFVEYEPSLDLSKRHLQYIKIFNVLVDALKNDCLQVFYQPILDVKLGQVVKYEALARVVDQSGNVIASPDDFMPISYQSRLCHKITRVVLEQVLSSIHSTNYVVSINLSVKDLFDSQTREFIVRTVRQSGLGSQIEFELLEQQHIPNYKTAAAYIKQLKSCVNAVGMDDLGKLYSNFDRLFSLPIDFVKIDGVIVEAIEKDTDAKSLVEGIVSFASEKNIDVVAEHCSSQSLCEMMTLLNVGLLQGFHIGIPGKGFEVEPSPYLK